MADSDLIAARTAPTSDVREAPSRSYTPWAVASFAVLVAVGLLSLVQPLSGDQAFFFVIARQIQHGDVLYRDVTDLKQPAIFWFYLAAGKLFGWSAASAHLAELLWWLAFAVVLRFTIARHFRHPILREVVPAGVGIAYYLGVNYYGLGQVEALVGFPLFVAWWFARQPRPDDARGRAALVVAGVAAVAVTLFKYTYVLVVVALWIVAFVLAKRRGADGRRLLRAAGWLAVGVAIPAAAFLVYFGAKGQFANIWDSWVTMPRQSRQLWPVTGHDIVHSVAWFGRRYLVLWVLAAYAAYRWLRRRTALAGELLLWMVVATIGVLPQHFWEYLWFVLFVPLALLAALALDLLLTEHRGVEWRRGFVAVAVLVVLAIPLWGTTFTNVSRLVRNDLGLTQTGRQAIAQAVLPDTNTIDQEVARLKAAPDLSGGLYVFGDPRIHFQADQPYPVRYHGWAFEYYTPDRWHDLATSLAAARPAYVFIESSWADLIRQRGPEVMQLLDQHYTAWATGPDGVWYHRT